LFLAPKTLPTLLPIVPKFVPKTLPKIQMRTPKFIPLEILLKALLNLLPIIPKILPKICMKTLKSIPKFYLKILPRTLPKIQMSTLEFTPKLLPKIHRMIRTPGTSTGSRVLLLSTKSQTSLVQMDDSSWKNDSVAWTMAFASAVENLAIWSVTVHSSCPGFI